MTELELNRNTMRRMKPILAVLLPSRGFGGHERMLVRWLVEIKAHNECFVRVYTRENRELKEMLAASDLEVNSSAYEKKVKKGLIFKILDAWSTIKILRQLPRQSVVLFAPGVVQSLTAHLIIAALMRVPAVVYVPMAFDSKMMRFRYSNIRDYLVRKVIKHVDFWVTITEQQECLLRHYWRVESPISVIRNMYVPHQERWVGTEEYRTFGERQTVLFLGRFDANQKGLDWLVNELIRNKSVWHGRMEFVFKGEGEFNGKLKEFESSFQDGSVRVVSWGCVDEELINSDVLLLPSRFEGFPLVAIEASYFKKPIVCSSYAGLDDILPSGSVFQFGNFDEMMSALDRMRNAEYRDQALAFTDERLREVLSPLSFKEAIINVMERILNMARS